MAKTDEGIVNIDMWSPRLRLAIDVAMRQVCEASWSWDYVPSRWSHKPAALIWLVTGGGATLDSRFGKYDARRGDFFLMPATGSEYHGRHDPATPLEVAWLLFKVFDARGRALQVASVEGIPFHSSLTDVGFAESLMGRLLETTGFMQGAWLRMLLDEVRRQNVVRGASETEQRIRELGRQIQANPARYRRLDDMRLECSCSKDHLIRLFRQYHGVTPGEFLIRARTDAARGLLAASSLSIKQIAAQLGHADASSFSRQFSERVGVSPSAFRQRH